MPSLSPLPSPPTSPSSTESSSSSSLVMWKASVSWVSRSESIEKYFIIWFLKPWNESLRRMRNRNWRCSNLNDIGLNISTITYKEGNQGDVDVSSGVGVSVGVAIESISSYFFGWNIQREKGKSLTKCLVCSVASWDKSATNDRLTHLVWACQHSRNLIWLVATLGWAELSVMSGAERCDWPRPPPAWSKETFEVVLWGGEGTGSVLTPPFNSASINSTRLLGKSGGSLWPCGNWFCEFGNQPPLSLFQASTKDLSVTRDKRV